MIESGIVILWTAAIFIAIIINLAIKPKFIPKLLGVFVLITAVGGLIFYGYGYACTLDSVILAVIRSTFAVCGMFVGGNEFSEICDAPAFQHVAVQILFWLLHILGLMASAGAAVTTLGASLLRKVRLFLSRRGDLSIIYGLNSNTLSFGRELLDSGIASLVYIDEAPELDKQEAAEAMGCVVRTDSDALSASVSFLRQVGLKAGKRKLNLYALHADADRNEGYSIAMINALNASGISPDQTSLTILGAEESTESVFLAAGDRYGFGNVSVIDEPEMAARILMRHYPPYKTIAFDPQGKAMEDFHCLVIGFGRMGQAALRFLVQNGQFEGSHFRGDVFAPNCSSVMGRISHQYGAMLREYDIGFHPYDGRSREIYTYLRDNVSTLKYIVIAVGNEKISVEIQRELSDYLTMLGSTAEIYRLGYGGIIHKDGPGAISQYPIYTKEILCSDQLDRMAMVLNHSYCHGPSPKADWAQCDYFSRMSSRASADFAPALLYAAGKTPEDLLDETWNPGETLLDNLAKTEHLRWNAFHYSMGFDTMPQDIWDARAQQHAKEREETGHGKTRIGKDLAARQHACLIPWETLDDLSRRENAVTGGNVDYKDADRRNVLALGDVIREYLKLEEN